MEKSIVVNYERRDDGRIYLSLLSGDKTQIDFNEWLTVMTGALSMTIRMAGEHGYKAEGEVYQMVKEHLEREFVNPDSFKDLVIKR